MCRFSTTKISADTSYGMSQTIISIFIVVNKDTNRKIRKTEFIYICGSKNGSSKHSKHRRCEAAKKAMCMSMSGIWNQNSNTVIYEKFCSYIFISIFSIGIKVGRPGPAPPTLLYRKGLVLPHTDKVR